MCSSRYAGPWGVPRHGNFGTEIKTILVLINQLCCSQYTSPKFTIALKRNTLTIHPNIAGSFTVPTIASDGGIPQKCVGSTQDEVTCVHKETALVQGQVVMKSLLLTSTVLSSTATHPP